MHRISLMEAAHYVGLLTESQRRDFVLKTHGAQIDVKFASSNQTDDIVNIITDGLEEGASVAERVVDYLTQYDPSPKKLYTLWLVQRFIKGELLLEDAPGAATYLAYFDTHKRRFDKKDIGQYKSMDELSLAIAEFKEVSDETALVNNDDMRVWYDSPNFTIAQPKSEAGAKSLGEGTIWCTAWENGNRWSYYDQTKGFIAVMIDKVDKTRWQFFFPKGADSNDYQKNRAEFMDRANKGIDLGAFLRRYPMVMLTLGEKLFFPYVEQIGFDLFSDELKGHLEKSQLLSAIKNVEGLAHLPPEIIDAEACDIIIGNFNFRTYSSGGIREIKDQKELIQYFDEKNLISVETLRSLAEMDEKAAAVIPDHLKEDDGVKISIAKTVLFNNIKFLVPEPWPKEVHSIWWAKSSHYNTTLTPDAVPEEYRSNEALVNIFNNGHEKLSKTKVAVDPEVIIAVMAKSIRILDHLRPQDKTQELMNVLSDRIARKPESAYVRVAKTFPISMWPLSAAGKMLEYFDGSAQTPKVTFSDLPELFKKDPTAVKLWINTNGVGGIPAEDVTDEHIVQCLESISPDTIKSAFAYCTPERLLSCCQPFVQTYHLKYILRELPESLRTRPVIQFFVDNGEVPIAQMKELANDAAILKRVRNGGHVGEIKDIPPALMNASLASKLVYRKDAIVDIPDKFLTEDVLYAYLKSEHEFSFKSPDERKHFARFSKDVWSPRTVAIAIYYGFIAPKLSEIPDDLQTGEVVASIAVREENVGQVLEDDDALSLISPEIASEMVSKNINTYQKLRPEQITTEVVLKMLTQYGRSARALVRDRAYSDSKIMDVLLTVPREKMSFDCWKAAVTLVFPLNSVPPKWRTDEMIKVAISRDGAAVRYLTNPSEWLDTHGKELLDTFSDSQSKTRFTEELANGGLMKVGKHYVDVVDMNHTPLSKGFSYIVIKKAKNFRVFVFDKRNKVIAQLYTESDTVHTPDINQLKASADVVREMAFNESDLFYRISINVLNFIGVYSINGSLVPVENLPRSKSLFPGSKMEWASTSHGANGNIYVGYIGKKKICEFDETKSAGAWGNSSINIGAFKGHLPYPKMWALAPEILDHMKRNAISGYCREAKKSGIDISHGRLGIFTDKKVIQHGLFSVWRCSGPGEMDKSIAIMHDTLGYLAKGVLRKSGVIDKIDIEWDFRKDNEHDMESEIHSLMKAMEGKIPF